MFQRSGLDGRRISIVDHRLGPVPLGDRADGGNIDQAHVRIGRGFEIDDLGLVRDRRFQCQGIGQVNMRDRDAKAAESMLEEGEGAAIQRLVCDQLVTGAQKAPQDRRDRAHAGGHGDGCLATFQRRHALFEQLGRRIGDAGIDMARRFARKPGAALFSGFEGES